MINWDDFDKIWARTSPLTPYQFSDSNYEQGWNFVGSTPPARQMWDYLQKQNDEKFKYLRDNFGTPNMVTSSSQMTDTEKVYVYLGSEAGWNSGHWYYYDEGTSSWADGGVYNSVAFVTDTTLSIAGQPADAKATGDALNSDRLATETAINELASTVPIVDPTLTISGAAADAKVTGRFDNAIQKDAFLTENALPVVVEGTLGNAVAETSITNGKVARIINNSLTITTSESSKWWNIYEYAVTPKTLYRVYGSQAMNTPIVIFLDSNGDYMTCSELDKNMTENYKRGTVDIVPPLGCAKILVNNFLTNPSATCHTLTYDAAMTDIVGLVNLRNGIMWELGNITNGSNSDSTTRIRTQRIYRFKYPVKLPRNKNVTLGLWTYSDNNFGNPQWVGWVSDASSEYIIPANTYFRLLTLDGAMSKYDYIKIYNNNLFDVINESANNNNNNIIKTGDFISICHQGYSETDALGHNLLSGYPLAKLKGFDYGECDLKLTSDNVLVCCHDATFIDQTTQETVTISQHTLAELQTYNYYGGTIATFDSIVKACKMNGIGLVIDHIGFSTRNLVFPIVKKYGMQRMVAYLLGYNETYPNLIEELYTAIHSADADAHFMVIPSSKKIVNDAAAFCNRIKTSTNKVELSLPYTAYTTNEIISLQSQLNSNVNVVIWTCDDYSTCMAYLPYVTAITSNKISSNALFAQE